MILGVGKLVTAGGPSATMQNSIKSIFQSQGNMTTKISFSSSSEEGSLWSQKQSSGNGCGIYMRTNSNAGTGGFTLYFVTYISGNLSWFTIIH